MTYLNSFNSTIPLDTVPSYVFSQACVKSQALYNMENNMHIYAMRYIYTLYNAINKHLAMEVKKALVSL